MKIYYSVTLSTAKLIGLEHSKFEVRGKQSYERIRIIKIAQNFVCHNSSRRQLS